MPFFKKVYPIREGVEEVEKVHSGRLGIKGLKHNVKINPTPEDVKRVNEQHRIRALHRKIDANFQFGDLHIVHTYKKEDRPSIEEGRQIFKKYLDNLREKYKKAGAILKYITVTEYLNTAIHHHLIINDISESHGVSSAKLVRGLWKKGKAYITVLDDTGDYKNLAAYFVKEERKRKEEGEERVSELSFSCSRNLIIPEPDIEIISSGTWLDVPVPKKGYWIKKDSIKNGIGKTGYKYQYYRMERCNKDLEHMPEEEREELRKEWVLPRFKKRE